VLAETGAREAVAAMIGERLRTSREALAAIDDLRPEGRLFLAGLIDYLWGREQ
jgi:hypothetical protein